MQIEKAVRRQRKARINLTGPSGSGKTFTALQLATGLAGPNGRILLIDSEQRSSVNYADDFNFDIINLEKTDVESYIAAINMIGSGKYDVGIIDSMTQAWEDVLEKVDNYTKRNKGNSFQAWGAEGTPVFKSLMSAILRSPAHVIATMRVKTDYVMEDYTTASGKTASKPVKVGLAPQFRAGNEYEFDVVANIDLNHELVIEKTRIKFLTDMVVKKPGVELGKKIKDWLDGGAVVEAPVNNGITHSEEVKETNYGADKNPHLYVVKGCAGCDVEVMGKTMVEIPLKKLQASLKPKFAGFTTDRDKVNIKAYLDILDQDTVPTPTTKEVIEADREKALLDDLPF